MGKKQMLSMALLPAMLSRRMLPGLLLIMSLPWASQTGQAVGTTAPMQECGAACVWLGKGLHPRNPQRRCWGLVKGQP